MNKRAFELSLTTIIELVLVLSVILVLSSVGTKFAKPFLEKISNNDDLQQFTTLVSTIKQGYTGTYPIFLSEKSVIVGFTNDATVSLACDNPRLTTSSNSFSSSVSVPTLLRKPALCRGQACLCLCQSFVDIDTDNGIRVYEVDERLCNPMVGSVNCILQQDLNTAGLTFTGGVFADGTTCDLAFIGGFDAPQNVYLSTLGGKVRICKESCDSSSVIASLPQEETLDLEVPSLPVELPPVSPRTLEGIYTTYADFIIAASRKYHVDSALIVAVIYTESRGKIDVVSCTGAVGLMQLQPETARNLGLFVPPYAMMELDSKVKKYCPNYVSKKKVTICNAGYPEHCNRAADERYDPAKNIDAGTKYLRQLQEKGSEQGYTGLNIIKYALSCYIGGCNPAASHSIGYYTPILQHREQAKEFTEALA